MNDKCSTAASQIPVVATFDSSMEWCLLGKIRSDHFFTVREKLQLSQAPTLKIYPKVAELIMYINPLNAELNSICHLLALLGAHPIFHVSRIRG
jgi:hypothetical protein